MITAINIMLSIMGWSNGIGDSESEADVVVDTNDVDGIVVVLVLNNGDDCVDSSFVTCDSEAIVRLVACDPISSKFKCSMQIDKYWLGAVFTPPCRCTDHKRWFPMFEIVDKKRGWITNGKRVTTTRKYSWIQRNAGCFLYIVTGFGVLFICCYNFHRRSILVLRLKSSMTSFEWFRECRSSNLIRFIVFSTKYFTC